MGTYKVFNGTDWVNICDCQVRIRNASNNWQLLDPTNCVTKYWTGTEWCEVTCTPLPPAGCTEPEVIIGTQRWTRTNLNVTQYRNGDIIPQVTDPIAWSNLTTGAWCHYNNDPANDAIYGKMYNGYAVNDSRGLAPNGFHVPTEAEWITLSNYLGGASNSAGGKLKEAGTTHWNSPNTGATNESCFTGLPGGYRFGSGAFSDIGNRGMFWTSTAGSLASSNWSYYLYYDVPYVLYSNYQRNVGLSVRLIRD